MDSESKLSWIGLQFFAEGGDGAGAGNDGGQAEGAQGAGGAGGSGTGAEGQQAAKTFTQEEVSRMLANEKRQGRQAALKALGLDPNDKDAEKKAKAILDEQKTQAERDAEAIKAEQDARSEAERKAEEAERKLAAIEAGCKREFIDEVTALAAVRVNDSTDFEAALKAVKEKCPSFFEGSDDTGGTGSGQGHRRGRTDSKPGSLGSRLAQGVTSSRPKENPYFNKT